MIPIWIVGSMLLTGSVCMAAGQIFLAVLKLNLYSEERWFFGFLTGSALVSTLVFLLAILRLLDLWVICGMSFCILCSWLTLRSPSSRASPFPRLSFRWRIVFLVLCLAFGVYYICAAMVPEISSDGLAYHVGLITRYHEMRGLYPIRTNMYASLPGGLEMLFLFAFIFGRHSATAMVHLLYLLSLPFGMLAYARRMGQPIVGVVGGLLFYMAPVVGRDGTVAYNDVAVAAIVFGCFYALQIWFRDRQAVALIPAGLLAGFAYACKYTTFTVTVYAVIFVMVVTLRRRENPWRPMAVLMLFVLLMISPWVLKNVAYVGNPVHPFFNRLFPNPYFSETMEHDYRMGMAHMNDIAYREIPWQVTVGGRLIGILGPVFLLAPLALLSIRSSMGRHLLLAFLFMLLPYFFNIGTRFLIPGLPFLALGLAAGLANFPIALVGVLAVHAILSWPSLIPYWAPANQWRLESFDWRAALRVTSEEEYLQAHLADWYRAGLMLDRFVRRSESVYAPSLNQLSYHHRDIVRSRLEQRIYQSLLVAAIPDQSKIWKRECTFPPVRTRILRLAPAMKQNGEWSVSEMRFYDGGEELRREQQWLLTASHNPWEVQLAFDNRPMSSWNSGRAAAPDMSIQVDFGEPRNISSVVAQQPWSQQYFTLAVHAAVNGQWVRMPAECKVDELPPPKDMRMALAAEIKAKGIHWILLRDGDYGAEELLKRGPYWGAIQVAKTDKFRLWKLE
jgi:hypothetical protein